MPRLELLIALRVTLVALVLTGIAYPLLTTGAALLLLPGRARGSLVADEQGRVVGSELIAQPFASAAYLQPRPSGATRREVTRFGGRSRAEGEPPPGGLPRARRAGPARAAQALPRFRRRGGQDVPDASGRP